jgi:hypothetical protein
MLTSRLPHKSRRITLVNSQQFPPIGLLPWIWSWWPTLGIDALKKHS